VTERLLAEQGLEELTTRRIAQAANVAHGVLYNHFANKDELILAGLLARVSRLVEEFEKACPSAGAGTLESNLTKLAAATLGLERGLLPLLSGMIGKRGLLGQFLAEVHSPDIGGPDRILRAIEDYLIAERRLGRVSVSADTHIVGVLLFAITQLQALVTHFRAPDATAAAGARQLAPFVSFLATNLTLPERRKA
jgi:AcrR family transcriptional regulator